MATRLLSSMPSSATPASPTMGSSASAAARPHAESAPPALRSFRSDTELASQKKMVVRIYFSDGAFKSIMITGATTAIEACRMFAEKVRMERFQHNFQLKEVTPTVERMVDHDERPFEVVHRWIKEGFKLSMDEKWRFVFTFSQAVQSRLLRKTKRLLFAQVQSELKQQMKGNAQAPKLGLKKTPHADEPPEGPRPSALPPSPRMHPSSPSSLASTAAAAPPVSPRICNIPTTAASLLESSTSHSSRAAAMPPDQDAAASSTPFFVSPSSPSPGAPPTLRGFSSLPPQQVTPRPEQLVPSPQSVPATGPQLGGGGGSPTGSIRVRRGARPSPLILTSFNIDNEAQLAEAESKYNRDPAKFTSVYAANPHLPSLAETAVVMTSAMQTPPAGGVSVECAASPVVDLPPPPASMVLPAIPQMQPVIPQMQPAASGRQQHQVSSGESWGGYDSSESDQSMGEDEGEGEDELVAMLVQSTLKESQARGITIRDCSAQMMNNLDDALAMLAKLEFEL